MFAQIARLAAFSSLLILSLDVDTVDAKSPSVAFDFGRTAECRDATPVDAVDIYPGEKIVELKVRVSVHLLAGSIGDVEELRIEIGDCDSRMRVHSFAPSTRLESRLSEDIQWTKTTETGGSWGASLGGEAPVILGDVVAHVTPTINGGHSDREVVTETERRIAPRHVVVASGTTNQEHGVFFKIRSSPQSSLEGVHDLIVRFVVSSKWRGDSVRVCCQASGEEKFLWMSQDATWGHVCRPVAVYLAGDLRARTAAERYVKRLGAGS